jgi:hypothetical protein
VILAAFLGVAVGAWGASPPPRPLPYPRLANIYLHGAVDIHAIPPLARWDVLVLDTAWSEAQLEQLRALNPRIQIFLYVCAHCLTSPPSPGNAWASGNYDYALQNDLWWRDVSGSVASDWPDTRLTNITDLSTVGPQGSWRDYIVSRVNWLLRERPAADGVFFDNFWGTLSWEQAQLRLDSNCNPSRNPAGCDGVADTPAALDTLWNHALVDVARRTRANLDLLDRIRPDHRHAMLGNRAADYFAWLNGAMYEHFPSGWGNAEYGNPYGYNWNEQMLAWPGGYLAAPFRAAPYNVQIVNAAADGDFSAPVRNAAFERQKRFTLGSALLGDGYYSLDAKTGGHGSLWWEPEYDHAGRGKGYLGLPRSPMVKVAAPTGPEMLVNSSFSNGTVGWPSLSSAAVGHLDVDPAVCHTSPASARISVSSVLPGGSFKVYQAPVQIVQGYAYTLGFWARAGGPQELRMSLYSTSCPGSNCTTSRRFRLSTWWTRYEVTFVSPATAGVGLNFFVTSPGVVWIDEVSLREGDSGVYRRDFDRGTVLVNYTATTRSVSLGRTMYRLRIPGSTVFDGAAVTSEMVPPWDARILLTSPVATDSPVPEEHHGALLPAEPNPFNARTVIRFELARAEHVWLRIYDVAGRLVRTLVDARLPAGPASATWDGTDRSSHPVRSGIYLCRISTPTFSASRKLALVQ